VVRAAALTRQQIKPLPFLVLGLLLFGAEHELIN
jgi:hypothetical protein